MTSGLRTEWVASLAAASLLMAAGVSRGAVYSDGFSSDTVGSQPIGWYAGQGTSGASKGIVDDSGGIGTGNAMEINTTAGGVTRPTVTSFDTQSLAVGDTLTLSFDIRMVGGVTTADRLVRFGLFNDGGTPVTANISSGSDTTVNDDVGYLARVATGVPVDSAITLDVTPSTKIGTLGTSFGANTKQAGAVIQDTSKHTLTLALTRTDDGMQALASMDGVSTSATAVDATAQNFSFNEIAIFASHDVQDMYIDNVNVERTTAAVPEPASLGLLGLSMAAAALRRRRKA